MEYNVDIKDIWRLYEQKQYSSALAKAQEYIKFFLDNFLGSAYMYLNTRSDKIPTFRKHPPRFIDTIKESFKLGIITEKEKNDLMYLKDLRNEILHDLFLEEKFKLGEERSPEEVRKAIEISEKLFLVFRDRSDNFTRNWFSWDEQLRSQGVTDINKQLATHVPSLLKKHIWEKHIT